MRHYDVVLVLDYFRSAAAYLSIIKHLAPRYSIGLYVTPGDPQLLDKNREAHKLFIDECVRLGAKQLADCPVDADLLIVQQRPYSRDTVAAISRTVSARRCIGYLTLAMAGLAPHDAFIEQFRIEKLYVPNKRLLRYLLARRNAERYYVDIDVEQVGLPFGQYPVYSEFAADYLVAAPTLFSFKDEQQKQAFLENVLALLEQIEPDDLVVYKPHNGAYWDYFGPRRYAAVGQIIASNALAFRAISSLRNRGEWLQRLYTAALHCKLQHRARPMQRLTPYASFALEAFLPGVRKGVIGGLSNTIWGALYFGKTFYNCVDEKKRAASQEDKLLPHKDGRHLLDVNLEFFGVPYCEGKLSGGVLGKGVIMPQDREGDLIKAVVADTEAARSA